jgi:hypothetical protein
MDYADILRPLLYRSPLFILWFVGFVLAILRWRHNGRASLFALIGFFILSISTFLATLFPPLVGELSKDYSETRVLVNFMLSSMRVFPFLDAAGWIFILFAIFSGRKPEPKQELTV